jgi:hypothetical protein
MDTGTKAVCPQNQIEPGLNMSHRARDRNISQSWKPEFTSSFSPLLFTIEESIHLMREHILDQIPETINNPLCTINSTPIRILGDTPNSILDHRHYLESIRPFVAKVEESPRNHQPDAQTRFLALDIHPGNHSYFVLDINNVDYVYETAHHDRYCYRWETRRDAQWAWGRPFAFGWWS